MFVNMPQLYFKTVIVSYYSRPVLSYLT